MKQHPPMSQDPARNCGEAGFTLIEMTIAILILTIGLLATAGAVTYALAASNMSRHVTDAKLMTTAVLEQMQTLRNAGQLTFGQIANAGAVDNSDATTPFAGFSTAFEPVSIVPGTDGIYGTPDDLSITAGADGIWGNADDVRDNTLARPNFARRIEISFLDGNINLRKIVVTTRFPGQNGSIYTIAGTSYLNNDLNQN
ncbi:MAG: prepilin-type N-terminal cleavage/methylation domain-containing protein [Pyrinomonadaceae bacterium MAG19_C2-C3]|nr:prepilin-type N-terminal cleavage/methylation domain-containing protein [Pyrinomonadaceae bacterium MAG19_C2-C3]